MTVQIVMRLLNRPDQDVLLRSAWTLYSHSVQYAL